MAESIKRSAAVAAVVVAATFSMHCGPDGPTTDGGGTGGDGGTVTDGGHGGDSGTGGDGGSTALCDMYPEGSPNRTTFARGEIRVPAQNTDGWLLFFRKIEDIGGTTFTTFGVYSESVSAPTYYGFELGQTRGVNVPSVGTVQMQLCARTSAACGSAPGQGNTGTGDPGCSATLAADRPWGL
ncbi:MAG TPA: hypothetical protein VLD37_06735 [Candidatus Bilamarchaeum sp.]|nr:hypothetical protein [Candidatus Bilamarchaeum sp.]